mmetsp:Transcript_9723/g.23784  ORF Transcript_9723/g.23784 Transcript_9723/m.23784 type:complete len:633 (-) Transcript_9723:87-1985(-)|eukprot:CAMPEP_0180134170 /NCGR_PEP_ID=MMETSP0986-20121125/9994_1 /TAXON_ID=697907 /ORGANISM="non described non described, Strain CCMP2293" /LENGTH=632 /DNA_ID=CAMNT_0022074463 /DNA_START=308 /DNA_END=2206 /DNA_ORIENTATION=+
MFTARAATVFMHRATHAAGKRALSSSTKAKRSWFGWRMQLGVVVVGSYGAYKAVGPMMYPACEDEIIHDLLLTDTTIAKRKERLVVLGTGWGAVAVMANIDPFKYEIVCVSPRNHFVMTPLLPSVTVGTVEPRTVVESIRAICPHVKFVEAECTSLDPKKQTVSFSTVMKESSSRAIKDGAKFRPDFELAYDKLIIAVGAENNTFNTPGVEQHAHFLKEIIDARRIRAAILDAFESACNPGQSEAERKRLLNFVVVGGGPTGVEFAAELADLLHEDLKHSFPKMKDDVKIQLIEATETVLSMFDKKISEATAENFKRENIDVHANTFVKEVKQKEVIIQRKGKKEFEAIPCSLVVWATGIRCRPIVNKMREAIGLKSQNNFRALVTDRYLKVKGADGIYSLGDCATIEMERLSDLSDMFFDEADQNKDGAVSLHEFREWTNANVEKYPQLQFIASSEEMEAQFRQASTTRWASSLAGGLLKKEEFKKVLEAADRTLRVLPATAQVAAQEGKYLAKHLNMLPTEFEEKNTVNSTVRWFKKMGSADEIKPFQYNHLGSLAYIGGDNAAADLRGVGTGIVASVIDSLGLSVLSGKGTYILWRSFYLSEQFSNRTKVLLCVDWMKAKIFGRDASRY